MTGSEARGRFSTTLSCALNLVEVQEVWARGLEAMGVATIITHALCVLGMEPISARAHHALTTIAVPILTLLNAGYQPMTRMEKSFRLRTSASLRTWLDVSLVELVARSVRSARPRGPVFQLRRHR